MLPQASPDISNVSYSEVEHASGASGLHRVRCVRASGLKSIVTYTYGACEDATCELHARHLEVPRDTTRGAYDSRKRHDSAPIYPRRPGFADSAELSCPSRGHTTSVVPPPSACAGVPHTHHATQHATPCYARAAISWKPGRLLGTPDLVNKTPLHVLARLASGPFPSRPTVSETLVVSVDVNAWKSWPIMLMILAGSNNVKANLWESLIKRWSVIYEGLIVAVLVNDAKNDRKSFVGHRGKREINSIV